MFTAWDWGILAVYVLATTWLGHKLAGRQQTFRDFFLAGRKLPWWAVSGSIVASEISAATLVAVPPVAWATGGNCTYLMLAIGTILARLIIGFGFIPAFYRREIYSPYEFMGQQLGPTVDRVTTGLFFLGGSLAQGVRLFLGGLVLDVITGMGIPSAVVLITVISVVWTWMGGISTVIWTEIVQFAVLLFGAGLALIMVFGTVQGGFQEIVRLGSEANKFKVFDFTLDRTTEFTLWCGLIGFTPLTLASHGTDQRMAQRLFCCQDYRAARNAILASSVAVLLWAMMLGVGIGLYAYYQQHPMNSEEQKQVGEYRDKIFPLFIKNVLPVGIKGILFGTIFMTATATATLAAMSQTAISTFYRPFLRKEPSEAHLIKVSRLFVLLAGILLCAVAFLCQRIYELQYRDLLRLALALTTYTYGAMLGAFLLALLPFRRDARGLLFGVPQAVLMIFALNWQHLLWAQVLICFSEAFLLGCGFWVLRREILKIIHLVLGVVLLMEITFLRFDFGPLRLAWPWFVPIGTMTTLWFGYVLGRVRS